MNTIEFKVTVGPNGRITLPPDIARQVPAGEQLLVVLYRSNGSEDDEAPEESVYDQLIDEPLTR